MTDGYLISPQLLQQIQQTVRHQLNTYGGGGIRRLPHQVQQHRQAILTADLLAAVDTLTDPSTAQARILIGSGSGDLVLSDDSVTVVNRFENISIDEGTYIKIEWIDGEWQPYAADCGPQSESWSFMGSSGGGGGGPSASAGVGGP